eukprot:9476704-Pyramimonas_sp.AAC.1
MRWRRSGQGGRREESPSICVEPSRVSLPQCKALSGAMISPKLQRAPRRMGRPEIIQTLGVTPFWESQGWVSVRVAHIL